MLLCTGAREASYRNIKSIADCPADAAKGSSNNYALKKKDELERVAKSNRVPIFVPYIVPYSVP